LISRDTLVFQPDLTAHVLATQQTPLQWVQTGKR